MRMASKALQRAFAPELARLGLSWAHYFFLRSLLEKDGVTQTELSARVALEPATLTGILDTMIAQGLVKRVPHELDRRKWLICLTPKGRQLRGPLLKTVRTALRSYLDGISPDDYRLFCRVLDRIEANANGLVEARVAESTRPPLRTAHPGKASRRSVV